METNTNTEVEATETESAIAFLAYEVDRLNNYFFDAIYSEGWKSWENSEQVAFRDTLEAFVAAAAIQREKFDGDVWKGHADGTVSLEVESIRAQRTGDKPGKKAEPVTAASLLAKRLKKS
jgi:hypothetical protein